MTNPPKPQPKSREDGINLIAAALERATGTQVVVASDTVGIVAIGEPSDFLAVAEVIWGDLVAQGFIIGYMKPKDPK